MCGCEYERQSPEEDLFNARGFPEAGAGDQRLPCRDRIGRHARPEWLSVELSRVSYAFGSAKSGRLDDRCTELIAWELDRARLGFSVLN